MGPSAGERVDNALGGAFRQGLRVDGVENLVSGRAYLWHTKQSSR